jgi:predicted acetyltransferase
MVKEFQEEDNPNAQYYMRLDIAELKDDFHKFLEREKDHRQGLNLPFGYVPSTNFWILDLDKEKVVGLVSLRHELNDNLRNYGGHIGYNIRKPERGKGYGTKALELALVKAKEIGLNKALVTCDHDNFASKKIIEKNGGEFETMNTMPSGRKKLLYWIET